MLASHRRHPARGIRGLGGRYQVLGGRNTYHEEHKGGWVGLPLPLSHPPLKAPAPYGANTVTV